MTQIETHRLFVRVRESGPVEAGFVRWTFFKYSDQLTIEDLAFLEELEIQNYVVEEVMLFDV